MGKSFIDSLKLLEADIQHANTLNIIEEKFGILCRTVGWAFEILSFFFWVFGLKMIVIKLVWRNQLHLILQISLFSLLLPILLLFDSLFCHSVFAFPFLIFKAWNGCFGAIWRRLLWGSQAEVANLQLKTSALGHPREKDGACIQMRLSYSPAARLFLFLVQWTDCNLAGALGMLRILIYLTYSDGKTTMSIYERKASIRDFYAVIFPSLLQLQRGITDLDDRKQKELCAKKYKRRDDGLEKRKLSEAELEWEEECGICMEMKSKVVLPNCGHSLCLMCYRNWRNRSQSCPFCRDCLKRMNSGDLWIYTDNTDIVDLTYIMRENLKRLFMYIDRLPLVIPDPVYVPYESHLG